MPQTDTGRAVNPEAGALPRPWLRWAFIAALVAGAIVAFVTLPVSEWLTAFIDWVQGLGALGVVLFALVYIAATVALLPGSVLTLGAGLIYGPVWGTVLVSPVSVAAATLAFMVSRYLLRDRFTRRIEKSRRLRAVYDGVNQQGTQVVFLLRLSPAIPFNLLNYVLGLTRVPLWSYVGASFVGMLPGTFLYVYLGSLGQTLDQRPADAGPWADVLLWGGLAATVLVTLLVTRAARRARAPRGSIPDAEESEP